MIEEGLFARLSADSGVLAAVANTNRTNGNGIYFGRFPKDPFFPAVSFRLVSAPPDPTLLDPDAIVKSRWQFDCVSPVPEKAVALARAIITCLNGFKGNLPDSDATRVTSCDKDTAFDTFYQDADTHDRVVDFLIQYAPAVGKS